MSAMTTLSRLLAVLGVLAAATGALSGQALPATQAPLVLQAYQLQHQAAIEALALVYPLLSERGTVELKPQENTLVVRDVPAHAQRILAALQSFDRPSRPVEVELRLLRATAQPFSPAPQSSSPALPAEVLQRLKDLMPYHSYHQLAATSLRSQEGEQVFYQLGGDYRFQFRVGKVSDDQRLRLHGFRVSRTPAAEGDAPDKSLAPEEQTLIHINLNLLLGQTLCLGLAPSEASSEALILVITARQGQVAGPLRVLRREPSEER